MNDTALPVRRANDSTHDLRGVRTVVANAFVDDPFSQWMFPNLPTRANCLAAVFGTMIEWYVQHGRVDVIDSGGEIIAAAIWDIPASEPVESLVLPSTDGLLCAIIGETRTGHVIEAYGSFVSTRPTVPYGYLHFLAVSPTHQRRGFGSLVVAPGFQAATDSSLPVHLETNNPNNLPFYGALGFVVTTETTLPHGGPTLWAMSRSNIPA
jgi:ribosomal protein S18 acetylase RimI-like enzyme